MTYSAIPQSPYAGIMCLVKINECVEPIDAKELGIKHYNSNTYQPLQGSIDSAFVSAEKNLKGWTVADLESKAKSSISLEKELAARADNCYALIATLNPATLFLTFWRVLNDKNPPDIQIPSILTDLSAEIVAITDSELISCNYTADLSEAINKLESLITETQYDESPHKMKNLTAAREIAKLHHHLNPNLLSTIHSLVDFDGHVPSEFDHPYHRASSFITGKERREFVTSALDREYAREVNINEVNEVVLWKA